MIRPAVIHVSRGLAVEALWLGRLLADMVPDEPEAIDLLALMLHAGARHAARRKPDGSYVPLDEQDPALWDAAAIDEAESLLKHASQSRRVGRFQLEAAIQSAHAARRSGRETDWSSIVVLYDELLRLTNSPVVALNRAVAIGRAKGAQAGLAALNTLASDSRLNEYQPYWAARAELLAHAGNAEESRAAYMRAIGLTIDPTVRQFLSNRADQQLIHGRCM
jgi:RNA polymerase sigma-70 factor (ECF subfamily)